MTERTEHRCHHADADQPRMLRAHQRGCDTSSCEGCVPCPERHCRRCGREHVTVDGRGTDQTCASCIAEVRALLAGIRGGAAVMLGEAIVSGLGSRALVLAGPSTDAVAFRRRVVHAMTTAFSTPRCARSGRCPMHHEDDVAGPGCRSCDHPSCAWVRRDQCVEVTAIHDDNPTREELHPHWVAGDWEDQARAVLDQPTAEPVRLSTSLDYLDRQLHILAQHPDFDFDQFAVELGRCHRHLEDVLRTGDREDRGAPCPACGRKRLVKFYGDTEADDRWTCPACDQWWTEDDYRSKVQGIYLEVADALTASQIQQRCRVNASTVRTWADRGKVRKRGKDGQRRQLYDVADVLAMRDDDTASQTQPDAS